MKLKVVLLLLITTIVLSACGQKQPIEPMTLVDQNNEEVTFPLEKPVVFFFITTYT